MSGFYDYESSFLATVSAEKLDNLLARGWRHFGTHFFRYRYNVEGGKVYHVVPLRIRLKNFSLSKSQRRVVRRNSDLRYEIQPIKIDKEKIDLFERHKTRFKKNIPSSIYNFVSRWPGVPCETMEINVFSGHRLVAASFFDVGVESVSSIYAIFEPEEKGRGLGILTMLLEIDFATATGKKFYYHGYAYMESSFYDYKKNFNGLEMYDWESKRWKRVCKGDLHQAD